MARRIYAALDRTVLGLTHDAGEWERETLLSDTDPRCLAVDRRDPDRVFVGTFDDGLRRSTDGGDSWHRVGESFAAERVMAVTIDPRDRPDGSGVVYAGTEPSALYRSLDGGETWTECEGLTDLASEPDWAFPGRPDTHHVRWIEPHPTDAGRLYVSVEMGAVVTTPDRGRTWHDRVPGSPRDAHTLATHPDAPDRVYAAAGDGYINAGREYAETHDANTTWAFHTDGLDHHYAWGVAVDSGDPTTRLVSTSFSPLQAHHVDADGLHGPSPGERSDGALSVIYRRRGDDAWEPCTDGLPDPEGTLVPVLAADPTAAGVFYALSNRDLHRSDDAGETWAAVTADWDDAYRRQHAQALVVV